MEAMTDGFAQNLSDLSSLIDQLQATDVDNLPQVTVIGADPDEFVRITITGSEASSVEIMAAALKKGNAELGDLVKAAINDALAKHARAMTEAFADTSTDFGALQTRLNEISRSSQAAMSKYLNAMDDVLRQTSAIAQANQSGPTQE